jgi:hypothetical protein
MNFFQRTQSFPPILLRLLARHKGGKPLTTHEIADRSGTGIGTDVCSINTDVCNRLSPLEVMEFSKQTSWKGIGALEMFAFMRGCNLMLDDTATMRRTLDYLRKNPNFEYLRANPDWDSYYRPLLITWRRSYEVVPSNVCEPVRALIVRLSPMLKYKVSVLS